MLSDNKYKLIYVMIGKKILGFGCDCSRYFLKYRNIDRVTAVVLK